LLHENEQKEYVKKLIAEFCISSTLDHENVVKTVDLIQDEVTWYFVCGNIGTIFSHPTDSFSIADCRRKNGVWLWTIAPVETYFHGYILVL
jgi:hypothetical protein